MQANENHNLNGQILLSQLKDPNNPGVAAQSGGEQSGVFWLTNKRNTGLNAIEIALAGNNLQRESIPSPLAQEEIFKLCVKRATPAGDNQHILRQWRGAVAARFLLNNCFWGANEDDLHCDQQSLRLEVAIPANIGGAVPNKFLEMMTKATGTRQWEIVCVYRSRNADRQALLQISEEVVAIPAANLNVFLDDNSHQSWLTAIPWVVVQKGRKDKNEETLNTLEFDDPIDYLSVSQLEVLADALSSKLHQPHPPRDAFNALTLFLTDVTNRLTLARKREWTDKQVEEWKRNLCVALLLRDALKTPLSVRDVDLKETGYLGGSDGIGVFLGRTPIAFLSPNILLDIHNPKALDHNEAFLLLNAQVCELLDNPSTQAILRVKLAMLAPHLLQLPWVAQLLGNLPQVNGTPLSIPGVVHTLVEPEANLLVDFSPFTSHFTRSYLNPNTLFSQILLLYTFDLKSESIHTSDEMLFYPPTIPTSWYTLPKEDNSGLQAQTAFVLLPLGVSGGRLLAEQQAYFGNPDLVDICLSVGKDEGHQRQIHVTYSQSVNGIRYTFSKTYAAEQIQMLTTLQDIPAIGIWPNVLTEQLSPPWNTFYNFISYPHQNTRYSAEVFCSREAAQPSASLDPIQLNVVGAAGFTSYSVQKTAIFPEFMLLKFNDSIAGVVPCRQQQSWPKHNHEVILAVDFGASSTVGAYIVTTGDRQAHNANALQAPLFTANSCVAWQLNQAYGEVESLQCFIPELMNVASDYNRSGALFSIVRRFNHAVGGVITGQPQLFLDGHIAYIGDNPPIYEPFVYSGLKFSQLTATIRTGNIRLFLSQLLHLYFLRCHQLGAQAIQVRFAMPLVMPLARRMEFFLLMTEICNEVAGNTGIHLCTPSGILFGSESRAVAAYFLSTRIAMQNGDTLVTIDIGGGTTDFSCFQKTIGNAAINADQYWSTLLAGRKMISERLFASAPTSRLHKEAEKLMLLSTAPTPPEPVPASTVRGTAKNTDMDAFVLAFDQQMRKENGTASSAGGIPPFHDLANQKESAVHSLLTFQLSLLMWFAGLLCDLLQTSATTAENEVLNDAGEVTDRQRIICLAGYGSNFYNILEPSTQKNIQRTALGEDADTIYHVVNSRAQKEEVAQGLLMLAENELTNELTNCNVATTYEIGGVPATVPASTLWSSFREFMDRYVKIFTDDHTVCAFWHDKVCQNNLRRMFLANCTTLQDLCAYLPNLCRTIDIDQYPGGNT